MSSISLTVLAETVVMDILSDHVYGERAWLTLSLCKCMLVLFPGVVNRKVVGGREGHTCGKHVVWLATTLGSDAGGHAHSWLVGVPCCGFGLLVGGGGRGS